VKVEKLAKNGQKGQNSQPLSPCGARGAHVGGDVFVNSAQVRVTNCIRDS